jgi:hypothetical protein
LFRVVSTGYVIVGILFFNSVGKGKVFLKLLTYVCKV